MIPAPESLWLRLSLLPCRPVNATVSEVSGDSLFTEGRKAMSDDKDREEYVPPQRPQVPGGPPVETQDEPLPPTGPGAGSGNSSGGGSGGSGGGGGG